MPITYEPIATTTLSGSSTVVFSSIPSSYTDLRVVLLASTSVNANPSMYFNADTGTNYSFTSLWGDGASARSSTAVSDTKINISTSATVANAVFFYEVNIFSYAGSTRKSCLIYSDEVTSSSGKTSQRVGLWNSTSSISTITFKLDTGNYGSGTATLYGILKA